MPRLKVVPRMHNVPLYPRCDAPPHSSLSQLHHLNLICVDTLSLNTEDLSTKERKKAQRSKDQFEQRERNRPTIFRPSPSPDSSLPQQQRPPSPWPPAASSTPRRQSSTRTTTTRRSPTSAPLSPRKKPLLRLPECWHLKPQADRRAPPSQRCHFQAPRLHLRHDLSPHRRLLHHRQHGLQRFADYLPRSRD